MTLPDAKERLRIPELWRILNLPGQPGAFCKCPWREERHASFSVSANGFLFNDFATGQGGDAIDFLMRATGLSREAACRKFIELAGGVQSPLPAIKRSLAATQEAQRALPKLPAWRTGTPEEHEALARLRHVSLAAVQLADSHLGMIRFGTWRNEASWFVTDKTRRNAQARRMDGRPWAHLGGAKAQTLPGCFANWPIGAEYAETHPFILLVEGGPDVLAGIHFALQEGRGDCFPVAMLGASQRIHAQALPFFTGKKVRICAHADEPGRQAAQRWAAQLRGAGARVDAVDCGGYRLTNNTLSNDLNDLTQIQNPDDLTGLLPE